MAIPKRRAPSHEDRLALLAHAQKFRDKPERYGELLADTYDDLYRAENLETDATVELLAEYASKRPPRAILEFGIGTGRLATKLRAKGFTVAGIDASEAMTTRLRREHPSISVEIGDYTVTRAEGEFSLVALLFNNIFDPRGEKAQRQCFEKAAEHLVDGGFFVIEAYILDSDQLKGEWFLSRRQGTPRKREGELELCRYDPNTHKVERTLVHKRADDPDVVFSVLDTYANTVTLDKMAEDEGFDVVKRYGGWRKEGQRFRRRTSSRHITVYKKRGKQRARSRKRFRRRWSTPSTSTADTPR